MQDDDLQPSSGMSQEAWKAFLNETERQDRAHAERRKTLRQRREAKQAERLGKPPVDLADAFRRHLRTCPHLHHTEDRKAWRKKNPWFEYGGKRWQRVTRPLRSNSGKSVTAWNPYYVSEDGERVEEPVAHSHRTNGPELVRGRE